MTDCCCLLLTLCSDRYVLDNGEGGICRDVVARQAAREKGGFIISHTGGLTEGNRASGTTVPRPHPALGGEIRSADRGYGPDEMRLKALRITTARRTQQQRMPGMLPQSKSNTRSLRAGPARCAVGPAVFCLGSLRAARFLPGGFPGRLFGRFGRARGV